MKLNLKIKFEMYANSAWMIEMLMKLKMPMLLVMRSVFVKLGLKCRLVGVLEGYWLP